MNGVPVLEAFLLVTALSVDAFAASFAYGSKKIKIPVSSVIIINLICSALLAVALLCGAAVSQFAPGAVTKTVSFLVLFILGIVKLFEGSLKTLIRKTDGKKLAFSLFSLRFILNIYAEPEKADKDMSRTLSAAEAAFLAFALSLDGIAVGFGAGLATAGLWEIILFSLVSDILAVVGGARLGQKAAEKLPLELSWVGGAILILLALMRL